MVYGTEQASKEGISSYWPSLVSSECRRKLKFLVFIRLSSASIVINGYVVLHPTEVFLKSYSVVKVSDFRCP